MPARSSAALRLGQRRAMRVILYGALGFVALNVVGFGLMALTMAGVGGGALAGLALAIMWLVGSLLLPIGVPLLFAATFAWVVFRHFRAPAALDGALDGRRAEPSRAAELATELALLEPIRQEAAGRTRRRLWTFVPIGIAIGVAIYSLPETARARSTSPLALPLLVGVGGLVAWFFAVAGVAGGYATRCKEALMPHLLQRRGALTYRPAGSAELGRLMRLGLVPLHDRVEDGDEIRGRYRDRDVCLNEVTLLKKGARRERMAFQGLVVALAPGLAGAPSIVLQDNAGSFAGERHATPPDLHRVAIGDPAFDEIYQVYGPSEDAVRAFLTAAVRDRLLTMADGRRFHPPGLLADGDRLVLTLQRVDGADLFEPPNLSTHDAARQLASLEDDVADVFAIIDAMIDLAAVIPGLAEREPGTHKG